MTGRFLAIGILVAGVVLSVAAHSDPIDDAQKARGHDNAKAYAIIKPLAEQGNAEAQAVLAGMYNSHEVPGQPEDGSEMAIHWMTKAAESGGAGYQSMLGSWLFNGFVGRADPKGAVPWLEKAAAQNDAVAEYLLGLAFSEGRGAPKNPAEAARWYQRAMDHGHRGAAEKLAGLIEMGRGLPQDDQRAFQLYLSDAEHGSAAAAQAVAEFYMDGRGVKQDRVEAYAWYTVFAVLSHASNDARIGPRDAMAETLSRAEIAEGQRRAIELFRPNDRMDFLSEAEKSVTGENLAQRTAAAEGFLDGTLVPQNFQKAFEILEPLAEKGHGPSMVVLARMYQEGLGMEPDLVEAYVLYRVGRDRAWGDYTSVAERGLAEVEGKMSPDLADYARKQAWKWQPKQPSAE